MQFRLAGRRGRTSQQWPLTNLLGTSLPLELRHKTSPLPELRLDTELRRFYGRLWTTTAEWLDGRRAAKPARAYQIAAFTLAGGKSFELAHELDDAVTAVRNPAAEMPFQQEERF